MRSALRPPSSRDPPTLRSLFLSHNGMTEPLGQSQVLPYLVGLARKGVDVEIISFEKAGTAKDALAAVEERLRREGIAWQPMVRSAAHGLGTKAWEAGTAVARGLAAALRRRPDIVHARSYLPGAAAHAIASLSPGAKLLFDVRGMLGDEYVDGGSWTRDDLRYKLVKRWEAHLFAHAGGIVVLTEALRSWLRAHRLVPAATPIEVVPCCVDTDTFQIDPAQRAKTRAALGLGERTVVVYSGTLGSWYKAAEMARFVGLLRAHRSDVMLLVLTHADAGELRRAAHAQGLGEGDVVVRKVAPSEMARTLCAGDVGLSLIEPCFSKKGSSPTKVAEYLAAGLTTVVNRGVGDQDELADEPDGCVVLPSFDEPSLAAGARRVAEILARPAAERAEAARRVADARFSLATLGVPRYLSLYRAMCERTAR